MIILAEVIAAVLVTLAITVAIWKITGLLLMPVMSRDETEIFTVLRVQGEATELEETLRGLMWLKDAGKLKSRIIIADVGLTPDAYERASALAQRFDATMCRSIDEMTEEIRWRQTNSPQ
jgi:hypothetical protein